MFLTRTQLALAPKDHNIRDADVHQRATLGTHCTSRPLTATASQVPALRARPAAPPLPSASDRHLPGLPHGPARAAVPGGVYKPSGARGSPSTPAHPPDRGARGASRLPGLHAPPGADLGHHRTLSLPTHTPVTAQTGRRPNVPEGTGHTCLWRCVLRCH